MVCVCKQARRRRRRRRRSCGPLPGPPWDAGVRQESRQRQREGSLTDQLTAQLDPAAVYEDVIGAAVQAEEAGAKLQQQQG